MSNQVREIKENESMDLSEEFDQILLGETIHPVYQPILSLSTGSVIGYEALTRGPVSGNFHSPDQLFDYAFRFKKLIHLEQMALDKAIRHSILDHPEQMLFINISADLIGAYGFIPEEKILEILRQYNLRPNKIVLEITEKRPLENFNKVKAMLNHYRSQGFKIAIDDIGTGYSSLQSIAELQPDFIKADRSLIGNIHIDKVKEYILESMLALARKLNVKLIVEGVEQIEELWKVVKMGVHYAQGYLIGRPNAERPVFDQTVIHQIESHSKAVQGTVGHSRIRDLMQPIRSYEKTTYISEIANYFDEEEKLYGVAIVEDQAPAGLIMREKLYKWLSKQYGYAVFWNRNISLIMDTSPLIVDEHTPIEEVSKLATSRDFQNLNDYVIVTSGGKLAGATSMRDILEYITKDKMEKARVANPLTGLPGNLQIQEELNRWLNDKPRFSVIYADLDNFKWFNDCFGFQKGDELIQFTADTLQQTVEICGSPVDFIGHIGGDDFIMLTTADEPVRMCGEIVRRFDQDVHNVYGNREVPDVMDRNGNVVSMNGATISLSLVICEEAKEVSAETISRTAAKLKKKAKSRTDSTYVYESLPSAEI